MTTTRLLVSLALVGCASPMAALQSQLTGGSMAGMLLIFGSIFAIVMMNDDKYKHGPAAKYA